MATTPTAPPGGTPSPRKRRRAITEQTLHALIEEFIVEWNKRTDQGELGPITTDTQTIEQLLKCLRYADFRRPRR